MHVAFLNPQGNFDPTDAHWTKHPDFGGQLVYVKEVALAMAGLGARVDIVTRRIRDPEWPQFSAEVDHYHGLPDNPRILRIPCGPDSFLRKEELWPHMDEFVANLITFYGSEMPDFATAHYADGGYCAVRLQSEASVRYSFTGHSLGAQKLEKLGATPDNLARLEETFRFSKRIHAERLAMERATTIITSTGQERFEQYAHPLYAGATDVRDDGRFAVIPPGVNTSVFTTEDRPEDEEVRERLFDESGSDEPYVIVASRLVPKKNIGGVVDAYVSSRALHERARLAIVLRGTEDPFGELSSLPPLERSVLRPILETIDGADLRDRVHFLDVRSQKTLASVYRVLGRRRSVFALTAHYEPFGLGPIEAAASGLAVVATRNGGPSEIFVDGAGVLVDPSDPEDIARGVLEALDDHAGYAERGRARVAAKYTWTATAAGYLEVSERGAALPKPAAQPVPRLDCSARIAEYVASL